MAIEARIEASMDVIDLDAIPGLDGYTGEWVIIKGDRVLAHDPDPGVIFRIADELGDDDIIIWMVTPPGVSVFCAT